MVVDSFFCFCTLARLYAYLFMGETYKLAANKRQMSKNSARETRAQARVPGVVYGHGFDPEPVSVDYSEFLRTYRRAGQASLIDLDIDGKASKVVIQDYDLDPVRDEFIHVDFFAVNLKEPITVHVPLTFVGESPAIKNLGGLLMKAHDAIDIRCLPTEIPHDLEVDISSMEEIGDNISIADLNLDAKFELMHYGADEVLCSIAAPRMAEEPTEAAEGEEGAEGEEAAGSEEAGE